MATVPTPMKSRPRAGFQAVIVLALAALLWFSIAGVVFLQVQTTNRMEVMPSEYGYAMGLDLKQTYPVYLPDHIKARPGSSYFVLKSNLRDHADTTKPVRLAFVSNGKSTNIALEVYVAMRYGNVAHSSLKFEYHDYLPLGYRFRSVKWCNWYPGCHTFPKDRGTVRDAPNWEEIHQAGLNEFLHWPNITKATIVFSLEDYLLLYDQSS